MTTTKYTIGFNGPNTVPGEYSDVVEYPDNTDKARIESARMLLDLFANNYSFYPDVFHALISWLRNPSDNFLCEPAKGFIYYIEPCAY